MSHIEAQAGLLDDANAVLEEFFMNGRKSLYVQKMKAVVFDGTEREVGGANGGGYNVAERKGDFNQEDEYYCVF
jgi:hypothetical protein